MHAAALDSEPNKDAYLGSDEDPQSHVAMAPPSQSDFIHAVCVMVMTGDEIDDVDRAIIHALQEDARNMSSGDIAERTGTSGSTVRKRIQRLESDGIVKGYSAEVDYQKSGYPLRMLLFCTAAIPDRSEQIPEILALDGVVSVQELVTGEQNLLVTAVGETDNDITPVAQELLDMGLTVADEVLVRSHETTPFGSFDTDSE